MNTLLPQFRVAAELEQRLGDTQLPQNLFSFKATMERDEGEVYPEQAVNFLNGLNLHHYYVPKALGGRFVNCEEILAIQISVLHATVEYVIATARSRRATTR